jgi:hypothetical protein
MLDKMEDCYKNTKFPEKLNEYGESILVFYDNIVAKHIVSFIIYSIKINLK